MGLRSQINSINNITLTERALTATILFCRSSASTIDDLIAEFQAYVYAILGVFVILQKYGFLFA